MVRYQHSVSATLDVRPAAVSALQTLGHAEVPETIGTRLAAKLLAADTSPSVAHTAKGAKRLLARLDLRLGIACDTEKYRLRPPMLRVVRGEPTRVL